MRRTLLFLSLSVSIASQAQELCGTIADRCEKHITTQYIPDGQFYRALLQGDEQAEFNLTLFGGTTYRVAACSGESDGILLFNVVDKDNNVLFSNKDQGSAPFWDLSVTNTIDVRIEAGLDLTKAGSGCAVMLIGFKK